MLKWIVSLLLTALILLNISILGSKLQELDNKHKRLKDYQIKKHKLGSYAKKLTSNKTRIQRWNKLWKEVQDSRLLSSEWIEQPTRLERTLSRSELRNLLENLSNPVNVQDQGFRQFFDPEKMELEYFPEKKASKRFHLTISGNFYLFYPDPGSKPKMDK